jgi:hypothetical protein
VSGRTTQRKYAIAGKCERCGEKKPASETLCTACLGQHNEATAASKAKLIAEGRCAWCGKKHKSGFRVCDPCREAYNERRRARKR